MTKRYEPNTVEIYLDDSGDYDDEPGAYCYRTTYRDGSGGFGYVLHGATLAEALRDLAKYVPTTRVQLSRDLAHELDDATGSLTIAVDAIDYEDHDDVLEAVERDYARSLRVPDGYAMGARWEDDARDRIYLDIPADRFTDGLMLATIN